MRALWFMMCRLLLHEEAHIALASGCLYCSQLQDQAKQERARVRERESSKKWDLSASSKAVWSLPHPVSIVADFSSLTDAAVSPSSNASFLDTLSESYHLCFCTICNMKMCCRESSQEAQKWRIDSLRYARKFMAWFWPGNFFLFSGWCYVNILKSMVVYWNVLEV